MSRLELRLKNLKHDYRHGYISKKKVKMNLEDKVCITVLDYSQVSNKGEEAVTLQPESCSASIVSHNPSCLYTHPLPCY